LATTKPQDGQPQKTQKTTKEVSAREVFASFVLLVANQKCAHGTQTLAICGVEEVS
jgi:hypothetical protein